MNDPETHVDPLTETPIGPAMLPVGDPEPEAGPSCSAVTKRGTVCGRRIAVAMTPNGPRCPAHAPKTSGRAPVRSIRSPQDAVRLASWAAVAVAEGRLGNQQANAVTNACREWRRSFEAADLARRFYALEALQNAMLANKRVSAAIEEEAQRDSVLADAFNEWKAGR